MLVTPSRTRAVSMLTARGLAGGLARYNATRAVAFNRYGLVAARRVGRNYFAARRNVAARIIQSRFRRSRLGYRRRR